MVLPHTKKSSGGQPSADDLGPDPFLLSPWPSLGAS